MKNNFHTIVDTGRESSFYIGLDVKPRLEEWLRKPSIKKVLLVRGKSSFETCGAAALWNELSKESGFPAFVHFFDFQNNPKIEDCQKGVTLCMQENIDAIVGIGGGSALDMGKLIRHFCQERTNRRLPLLVMPTTAGTGAEATHFAVCYVNGEKTSVSHKDIRPDNVLIYPPFAYHTPSYLTACTGFDAVAHAIESYWSVNSNEESRKWVLQALDKIWTQLPALMRNPNDTSLHEEIAEGSYYAGRAIDLTTTTAAHAFSYKFTTLLGYPHGHAVALTFPFWFAHNTTTKQNLSPSIDPQEYEKRLNRLMEVLNCRFKDYAGRISFMEDYISSVGLSKGTFNIMQLQEIINAFNAERAKNNPIIIVEQTKEKLLNYLSLR